MKMNNRLKPLTIACIAALGMSISQQALAGDGAIAGQINDSAEARVYVGAKLKSKN